jgi:hypothetical protein
MKMNHVHFTIGLSTYNSVITRMHSDFEVLIIVGAPFCCFENLCIQLVFVHLVFLFMLSLAYAPIFLLNTLFLI